MKRDEWREMVIEAVHQKDGALLDSIAGLLERQEQAKQRLRDLGYGVTGMDLLELVEEVAAGVDNTDVLIKAQNLRRAIVRATYAGSAKMLVDEEEDV
jgi:hypothetical protein